MRKRILNWLFGTDNIEHYMELLSKSIDHGRECEDLIKDHLKTLDREKETLNNILKLIKICKNHGIDVDKEMRQIEL